MDGREVKARQLGAFSVAGCVAAVGLTRDAWRRGGMKDAKSGKIATPYVDVYV